MPAAISIKHKGEIYTVLVDSDKLEDISAYKWSLGRCGNALYVKRSVSIKNNAPKQSVYLHRYIAKAIRGDIVDHINGDTLDNRLSNLRCVSTVVNVHNKHKMYGTNTSGVRGVSWYKARSVWRARVKVMYKDLHLGYFTDLVDAERASNEAHKFIHTLTSEELTYERVQHWRNERFGYTKTGLRRIFVSPGVADVCTIPSQT